MAESEQHKLGTWLRDVILGGQDGLVNVLGIILGISAANGHPQIIIAASLAATFAEAVSMGAVAYTSANAEKSHYEKELAREEYEVDHFRQKEIEEIRQVYLQKGFSGRLLEDIVHGVTADKKIWVQTMMTEELNLRFIDTSQLIKSSLVVALAAIVGGLIPLFPFFFLSPSLATPISLGISASALFIVGVYEAKSFVGSPLKQGIQMVIIGLGAAVVGYLIGHFLRVP